MAALKILKILNIIFLHFLIILNIKNGLPFLTNLKTFNIFYFLLCFFYILSSGYYFYRRDRAKGFFSFSILLFLVLLYLKIGLYKKIQVSQGEGEEGYTLVNEVSGVMSSKKIFPVFIEKIERGEVRFNFKGKNFILKEGESLKKLFFSLKVIKIFDGLEISLSFQNGQIIEKILYKPETPPFYFSPTTLPYRIYILKERENYKVKIFRNKIYLREKILKEEEPFSFEGMVFKYKKSMKGAIYEIEKNLSLYIFLIPLIIFLFSIYDKLKK